MTEPIQLLSEHDAVVPRSALCDLRPELVGTSGKVLSIEGDEALVEFVGRPRLYRVPATLLRKGT
jgi:hypothetical protein